MSPLERLPLMPEPVRVPDPEFQEIRQGRCNG
jgi:hypothetical protein